MIHVMVGGFFMCGSAWAAYTGVGFSSLMGENAAWFWAGFCIATAPFLHRSSGDKGE
jgi:hypothetical protein